eukprot:137364_1
MATSSQPIEEHHQLNVAGDERGIATTTTDPFDQNYDDEDPFTDNVDIKEDNETNLTVPSISHKTPLTKQMTLYSTLEELNEPLPLPHKNNCWATMRYHFETFLAVQPRIFSLYLLYSSTWPRGLVLLDMY